jgi:tRNA pseudouridine55 synthase
MRAVNGVLLLNKPAGLTSNQALQRAKRLFRARKAGHTGSLDPAATGMLPLCFGEATKVSAYLLDADKCYRVTAALGVSTDTGDAQGKELATAPVPKLDRTEWECILASFLGESEQIPPMYSALKKDGKRLYELARKGEVVDRPPRKIRITEIALMEAHGKRLVFRVCCSKGTYVRTLVEDIASKAGTVAHTANLYRETVSGFAERDMVSLEQIEALAAQGETELDALLIPVDGALPGWQAQDLSAVQAAAFRQGQPVGLEAGQAQGLRRVYDEAGAFLGIGRMLEDGRLAPERVFRLENQPITVGKPPG